MQARFICPSESCGADVWEFLTTPMSRNIRMGPGGAEVVEVFDILCGNCADQHLVELLTIEMGQSSARLIDSPETAVSLTPIDELLAEFDYLEPPDDPYGVFRSATLELVRFMEAQNDAEDGGSTVTRMVFVQCFGAFEAYLADTLGTVVSENADARRRLITGAEGLSGQTVKLIEVESRPEIVMQKVRGYLRAVSYHDLQRVRRLYRIAVEIEILPADDGKSKEVLEGATPKRHDCVHRNGRNTEGNLHVDITHRYVRQVTEAMQGVVDTIEDHVHPPEKLPRMFSAVGLPDDDIPF